jgi:uncharacterized protein
MKHALDIAAHEPVDDEVLTAAVLFHDIVNLPKNHPERKTGSRRSADHAVAYFSTFSDVQRETLHDAIVSHSFSAGLEPTTSEGRVLRDADRLESLGALGIARVFYVSGLMDGALFSPNDPFGATRELDDVAFAVDHFYKKVLKLEQTMLTNRGRELARDYTAFVSLYLDRLRSEIT